MLRTSKYLGVDRAEDIDIFEFYADPVIKEMISQPVTFSSSPESLFSRGSFVLNDFRKSTSPVRKKSSSFFYQIQMQACK